MYAAVRQSLGCIVGRSLASRAWQCRSVQLQVAPLATATFQLPPHIHGQQGKNSEQQESNSKGSFFSTNNLLWLCGLGGIVLCQKFKQLSADTNFLSSPVVHCAEESLKKYNFFAEVVEQAAPSVVRIEKKKTPDHFKSLGSGFIVDDGNFVLTNAHVVKEVTVEWEVQVELQDGRKIKGHVINIDEETDLALVKLELGDRKLQTLEFGSSRNLKAGEWVVAIGSPLPNSATAGIVSYVDWSLQREDKKPNMEYIQTDVAVTPGNSGGPLVNLDGKVIGVHTMSASNVPGVSFAVPSDIAENFVKQAIKTTIQGYCFIIGVSMMTVTPHIKRCLQHSSSLPSHITHGVLITNVEPDQPASHAGLKKNDVIIKVNGDSVEQRSQLHHRVERGRKLKLEVVRKEKRFEIEVEPEVKSTPVLPYWI